MIQREKTGEGGMKRDTFSIRFSSQKYFKTTVLNCFLFYFEVQTTRTALPPSHDLGKGIVQEINCQGTKCTGLVFVWCA